MVTSKAFAAYHGLTSLELILDSFADSEMIIENYSAVAASEPKTRLMPVKDIIDNVKNNVECEHPMFVHDMPRVHRGSYDIPKAIYALDAPSAIQKVAIAVTKHRATQDWWVQMEAPQEIYWYREAKSGLCWQRNARIGYQWLTIELDTEMPYTPEVRQLWSFVKMDHLPTTKQQKILKGFAEKDEDYLPLAESLRILALRAGDTLVISSGAFYAPVNVTHSCVTGGIAVPRGKLIKHIRSGEFKEVLAAENAKAS